MLVPATPSPTRELAGRVTLPALRWKDFYHVAGGDVAVVVKSLLTGLIAILSLFVFNAGSSASDMFPIYGGLVAFWSALLLGLCVAIDAARIFQRERDAQTLSSLMMLPYSPGRLCWEKMMGCMKASLPPAIGVALGLACFGVAAAENLTFPQWQAP